MLIFVVTRHAARDRSVRRKVLRLWNLQSVPAHSERLRNQRAMRNPRTSAGTVTVSSIAKSFGGVHVLEGNNGVFRRSSGYMQSSVRTAQAKALSSTSLTGRHRPGPGRGRAQREDVSTLPPHHALPARAGHQDANAVHFPDLTVAQNLRTGGIGFAETQLGYRQIVLTASACANHSKRRSG